MPWTRRRQKRLQETFLRQLPHGLIEPLLPRVHRSQRGKAFGRELRDRREPDRCTGIQRVADSELPGVHQSDHVARVRLGHRLALTPEDAIHPRQAQRRAEPLVRDQHVLGELPCADAKGCDAIPVPRIHVCLDLEHESGEVRRGGIDHPAIAVARLRRERQRQQRLEKRFDAEVMEGAPEEDWRLAAGAVFRPIEGGACSPEDLDRLRKLVLPPRGGHVGDQRIPRMCHRYGRGALPSMLPFVEQQLPLREVVYGRETGPRPRAASSKGAAAIPSTRSSSSISSNGSREGWSSLFTNVRTGMRRVPHTPNSLSVCASTPSRRRSP